MIKKRTWTSILAALLCLVMLLSLAGCGGKKTDTSDNNNNNGKEPSGQTNTDVEETPDYVFVPEFLRLKGAEFESGFNSLIYTNGRFLSSTYGKIGERELEEGEVLEWEGQNWIYGTKLFWIDLDGTVEPVEGYEPLTVELEEGEQGSAYLSVLLASPDGNIIAIEEVYRSYYDGPDDVEMYSDAWYEKGYYEYQHNEEQYFVRTLAPDGSEISQFTLDEVTKQLGEDTYFYPNAVRAGGDGYLYISSDNVIYIMAPDGKLFGSIETDNWVDNLLILPENRMGAIFWDETGPVMAEIDLNTLELGEPVPTKNAYNMAENIGGSCDMYYTDGSNFFGFHQNTGESEKILNWINCDLLNPNNICVLSDDQIVTMQSNYNEKIQQVENELVVLNRIPYASAPHRETITLATQYLDYQVRRSLIDFNKKNTDYRIEVRDYSEYNTEEDYSAGLTKLTTEIMSGKVPDILALDGLPYDKLVAQGLLADLYPLMNKDSGINTNTLFPSVVKLMENDGHLYRTATGFQVMTVVGATSIVGPKAGWTLKDFKAALAKMPRGCDPLNLTTTRGEILYTMLGLELDSLVDMNAGKCNFDSPAFKEILEFAAQFPESFDWDKYEWSEEDDEYKRVMQGKQMLISAWIGDFDSIQMYDAIFGGEATYIGYPVSEGVGSAIQLDGAGYAITSRCSNPDAAWQFLRQFFTKEYQEQYVWSFPTNMDAFNAKLEEAMTPRYQQDYEGNFILDENGNKIEMSRGGMGWGDMQIEFYAMTEQQKDHLLDMISNINRTYSENSELIEIITTDTQAYFAGQKSLSDVAKQLQSKLNIYINEQR